MPLPEALQPLHTFFMIVSFVFGTLVGSFCNVCASRWPAGESVVSPRSRCPKCMTAIAWYDNFPLLSWLVLGAKCRHCGQPISWQYPLVEAITGVLFFLVYWRFGFAAATPVYMAFAAAMVIVTFQDLTDWTIPNEITIPGMGIGLVLSLAGMVYPQGSLLRVSSPFDAVGGLLLGGGIIYLLDRITVLILKKPGMGFGDVKLLAMLGAFLGWKGVLFILMAASMLGSIVGVSLILYLKTRTGAVPEPGPDSGEDADGEEITLQGHYLPFGPYLAFAGLLYMFVGPEFIAFYFAGI